MKIYAIVEEFDDGSIQIAEKTSDFEEWVDGDEEFINVNDLKKELKEALKREFLNGNLKHRFNKKFVSDENILMFLWKTLRRN